MGDNHGRVGLDTTWTTNETWPVPVECLLSGIPQLDSHLAFGGPPIIHPNPFRQRFQSPPHLQLNGTSAHLVPVSLSAHSIIENSVEVVDRTMQVRPSAEDGQVLPQNIPLQDDDVLDDSDEGTSEEEELTQNEHHPLAMTHDTLVQVPCGEVSTDSMVHRNTAHCHPKQLTTIVNTAEIMAESLVHPIPSLNPIFFPPPEPEEFDSSEDTINEFPVYGKLYYERGEVGRIVLNLKQDNSNFPPDELGKIPLPHGCPICKLHSPIGQNGNTHRFQKHGHRHTFSGVIFTFEEFTVLEIHPEQNPFITSNRNALKAVNVHPKLVLPQTTPQVVSIPTYMDRSISEQSVDDRLSAKLMDQTQRSQAQQPSHLDLSSLPPPQPQHPDKEPSESWWATFDSGRDEGQKDEDSSDVSEDGQNGLTHGRPIPGDEEHLAACRGQETQPPSYTKESSVNYCEEATYSHPGNKSEESSQEQTIESLMLPDRHQSPTLENLSTPTNEAIGERDETELTFGIVETPDEGGLVQPPPIATRSDKLCKGKYACPCCDKILPLKKLLKIHLETEHPRNPYRCSTCYIQVTDETKLLKHFCSPNRRNSKRGRRKVPMQIEKLNYDKTPSPLPPTHYKSNPNQTKCTLPLKKSFTKEQHKRTAGFGKIQQHPKKLSVKSHTCNICGKAFSVARRLETHRLSHGTEKGSQCDKCGKRFARKDKLMRHMFVHSETKLFVCEICEKRFSRRDKLTDHLKSHGGPDDSHDCPLCNKKFLRPDILKQHLRLHATGNKYQCVECLRFVTGKDRLAQHVSRHEEAKAQGQPLLCPLCPEKTFIQYQSLKAHMKKFHPSGHGRCGDSKNEDEDDDPDSPCQTSECQVKEEILKRLSKKASQTRPTKLRRQMKSKIKTNEKKKESPLTEDDTGIESGCTMVSLNLIIPAVEPPTPSPSSRSPGNGLVVDTSIPHAHVHHSLPHRLAIGPISHPHFHFNSQPPLAHTPLAASPIAGNSLLVTTTNGTMGTTALISQHSLTSGLASATGPHHPHHLTMQQPSSMCGPPPYVIYSSPYYQ